MTVSRLTSLSHPAQHRVCRGAISPKASDLCIDKILRPWAGVYAVDCPSNQHYYRDT